MTGRPSPPLQLPKRLRVAIEKRPKSHKEPHLVVARARSERFRLALVVTRRSPFWFACQRPADRPKLRWSRRARVILLRKWRTRTGGLLPTQERLNRELRRRTDVVGMTNVN